MIRSKKREDFKEFTSNLNVHTNQAYVWKKMKVMKNGFDNVDWNKWQVRDRKKVIENSIKCLAPPWVQENQM